ncbi:MAG: thiamine phosphate synthase [Burkholderiales bacterium]|nr:thiamine phosphate synthase [Burkholderiales bacterium]
MPNQIRTDRQLRNRCLGLYAITPETTDDAWLLERVEQALRGGASLLQYRAKDADRHTRYRQAQRLLELCRSLGVPLLINDDVQLARDIGAEGVHLGRDDIHPQQARVVLGDTAIIGLSCYAELERLSLADRSGADYAAFGSFHPSVIKPAAVRPSPDILAHARQRSALPLVAIGGITPQNAPALIERGADALAVISALFHVPDTFAAARAFAACFAPRPCEFNLS